MSNEQSSEELKRQELKIQNQKKLERKKQGIEKKEPEKENLPELVDPAAEQLEHDYIRSKGYSILSMLGEGSYSKVKKVKKIVEEGGKERVYALKIINLKAKSKRTKKYSITINNELHILKTFKHANLVKFYEYFYTDKKIYFVMECCKCDLRSLLKNRGIVKEPMIQYIFRQACDGVEFLHENRVAHRDIKCRNILLTSSYHVRISDYSFSRPFNNYKKYDTYCGTQPYSCPEILQGVPYSCVSADLWALGVVLYVMATVRYPYPAEGAMNIVKEQQKPLGLPEDLKSEFDPEFYHLLSNILNFDSEKRYVMNDIRLDPWYQRVFRIQQRSEDPIQPKWGYSLSSSQKPSLLQDTSNLSHYPLLLLQR